MRGLIEKRLQASLMMDCINGDSTLRGIVESQCQEAVSTIIELRREVARLQAELDEIRQDRATMYNPVQAT